MDCSHPTTRLILSDGRYSGVAFCADCGAQLETKGDDMPTIHPVDENDLEDLEPYTVCDRCGEETPVVDTSTGLETWLEWAGATLCPDCWAEVEDGE